MIRIPDPVVGPDGNSFAQFRELQLPGDGPGGRRYTLPMEIIPLGDQAVLVHAPDEESAGRLAAAIRSAPPAWLVDLVLSYSSVALHYDRRAVRSADAIAWTRAVKVGR